ncbi:MAG: hypothetical protein OXQ29_19365 [Rhodospirillaceae bacterium]|nr:hypothetical protein [Rhodospirillaceae bacterium]
MGAGQSLSINSLKFCVVFMLALVSAQSANAQAPNASVGTTIETAATALGMVRGVGRRMDSINTVEFSGRGTLNVPGGDGEWTRYEITEATVGMSYSIPAMRWDMTRVGTAREAQRTICVVRDDRGWNERLPGVDPVEVEASDQVRCRLEQVWLTPHGFMTTVVQNPEAVTVGSREGRTTLTVEIDGMPATATLDENSRPASVAMTIDHPVLGATQLEATYSDYVDWPLLDVFFPSHIVHRLGGETTMDLEVTEFFQNPYVVFPTPEQLSRGLQ